MILLISHDSNEHTTETVMDWISYLGGRCQRLNGVDLLQERKFKISLSANADLTLTSDDQIEDAKINWFRRWMDKNKLDDLLPKDLIFFSTDVCDLTRSEFDGITNAFFYALNNKHWDNQPVFLKPYPIKIRQLQIAKNVGLTIPASIITNNKKDLQLFKQNNGIKNLIIKPIKEGHMVGSETQFYVIYTSKVGHTMDDFPDLFFPSLFQELIPKQTELRIFYYNEKCYTMAIFSSLDKQTEVDFRQYNTEKPNRYVPFTLPSDIEKKIQILMKALELSTGSLDIILTSTNQYVFLEVNPVGQFGMVSDPCNYFLEKIVAENLILKANNYI